MEHVEEICKAVDRLTAGTTAIQPLTPTQFCSVHRMGPSLIDLEKESIDKAIGQLESLLSRFGAALEKIPIQSRNKRIVQLKDLAKIEAYSELTKPVERMLVFSNYDEDQRKFRIEKQLGTRSLALPSRLTAIAVKVGLELYNSLTDERKIYLNNEDLLIEINYDKETGQALDVDISLTENEEEVKLPNEAQDILEILKQPSAAVLEDRLRGLIRRASASVALVRESSPIFLRQLEDSLQNTIKKDFPEYSCFKTTKGLKLELVELYEFNATTLRVNRKTIQEVLISIIKSGKCICTLVPGIPLATGHAQYLNNLLGESMSTETEAGKENGLLAALLSFHANEPICDLKEISQLGEIISVFQFERVTYTFRLQQTLQDMKCAPIIVYNFVYAAGQSFSSPNSSEKLNGILSFLGRAAVFNSIVEGCFARQFSNYSQNIQNDSSHLDEPHIKRRRLWFAEDAKSTRIEGENHKEVVIELMPYKFMLQLYYQGQTISVEILDKKNIAVKIDGLTDDWAKHLNLLLQKTHSLALLIHYIDTKGEPIR